MSLIDDIKRDREAGTPGPWGAALERGCHGVIAQSLPEGGANFVALVGNGSDNPDREESRFANARRIARVPEMEAALIAAPHLADVDAETKRCMRIVSAARSGDIDQDFRTLLHFIETGDQMLLNEKTHEYEHDAKRRDREAAAAYSTPPEADQ